MNFASPPKKVCKRAAKTGRAFFITAHCSWAVGRASARLLDSSVGRASHLTSQFLLRQQCTNPIHGENAVATTHQLESAPVGPVAQRLVQGTHRQTVPSRRKPRSGRDEFREPFRSATDGNPEPSRRYIAGRCRDYLRAAAQTPRAPLMTGKSVPHPKRATSRVKR
jgi:hypothetical protein